MVEFSRLGSIDDNFLCSSPHHRVWLFLPFPRYLSPQGYPLVCFILTLFFFCSQGPTPDSAFFPPSSTKQECGPQLHAPTLGGANQMWGREKILSSTHLRLPGWSPVNETDKRQIHKRKINRSLLTCASHIYLGVMSNS